MRVLFVTKNYPPLIGGMESLSYHLTTGFPEPKTIIALGRGHWHLWWFLPYSIIRVACTGWRYDIIHLGDAVMAAVGFIPGVVFRKKVVINLLGLDLTYSHPIYQWYLNIFLRASGYIVISRYTAKLAQQRRLAPLTIIPPGVDEEYFHIKRDRRADQAIATLRQEKIVLLSVARLVHRKGIDWFVEHVLPHLPGALYVVVGDGPCHAHINEISKRIGVTDRVVLLGQVPSVRLKKIYSMADLFIMPNIKISGDVEGFGIVAIEAAAAGIPVIAAAIDGIPDAIRNNRNGKLVEGGNTPAFLATIQPWLEFTTERERFGQRARQYTRDNFSWPLICSRYADFFESII